MLSFACTRQAPRYYYRSLDENSVKAACAVYDKNCWEGGRRRVLLIKNIIIKYNIQRGCLCPDIFKLESKKYGSERPTSIPGSAPGLCVKRAAR